MKHYLAYRNKIFFRSLGLLLLLSLWGCGGASPPAGIPAPVAELLSVSTPDSSGTVFLVGASGSVNPGSLVIAKTPLLKTSLNKDAPFQKQQTNANTATARAQEDGSFRLPILASVGTSIQVTQSVGDAVSDPTYLTVENDVLNLGNTPRVVTVNGDTAYVATQNSESLDVFALNFAGDLEQVSLPQPKFRIAGPASVEDIDFNLGTQSLILISRSTDRLYELSTTDESATEATSTKGPQSLDLLPSLNLGVVGLTGESAIQIYDSTSNSLVCDFTILNSLTPDIAHETTRFVAVTLDSNAKLPRLTLLSLYADGSWMLAQRDFASCEDLINVQNIPLPTLSNPSALAVFAMGHQAILTDAARGEVVLVDFDTGETLILPDFAEPSDVIVGADGTYAYVVNQGDNSVARIALQEDFKVTTKKAVGLSPSKLHFLSNESRAVLLSTFDNTVRILDLDF